MAYSGWLVKVGYFIIDTKKYIKAESYSAYVNMQMLAHGLIQIVFRIGGR